jgi:hypothetical protein
MHLAIPFYEKVALQKIADKYYFIILRGKNNAADNYAEHRGQARYKILWGHRR